MKSRKYGALHVLQGVGVSPGVAQGSVCRLQTEGPVVNRLHIQPASVSDELERLAVARRQTRKQLLEIKEQLRDKVGLETAYILDAHVLILEDPSLQESIKKKIREELHTAEWAIQEVTEQLLAAYRSIPDPIFRERRSDLEEVLERLSLNLLELEPAQGITQDEDLVLVGSSISLSILADFDVSRIRGMVSTRGGSASHLTILARSLQIPMVAAVDNLTLLNSGRKVLVDGNRGLVMIEPESLTAIQQNQPEDEQPPDSHEWKATVPTRTLDGREISLLANTELDQDLDQARNAGAEGVGLFRTEYLFMSRKNKAVPEEEQFETYRRLAEFVGRRPAHVRTLDIGNEGHPFFTHLAGDSEPVLGLRGIRLGLRHPEILVPQIRAILRAARFGNLKLVLPMVSSVDEVVQARSLIDEISSRLSRESGHSQSIEVGAMLEVPAAVLCLESLAEITDFFLVGTNDLIQYTLAVGRNDQGVAHLFQPLHPAVLCSLARIVEVTRQANRPVIVCGEMAAQPRLAGLLLGMGFQQLSMNPRSIQPVRERIEALNYADLKRAASEVLALKRVSAIEEYVARSELLAIHRHMV